MIRSLRISLALAALLNVGVNPATAAGDAEKGAAVFRKCKACHQVGAEAKNRVGPQLNDIIGRVAGSLEGMQYSGSMIRAGEEGLIWTEETLDRFLANPKGLVPETRMSFPGLRDPQDRVDVVAYLAAYSANVTAEQTATSVGPMLDPAILAIEGDAEYGEYLSSECKACHQTDGADDGIPGITRWHPDDFVTAMHAYRQKIRPHPVMQMLAARLSDEEIAALAAYFKDLE